MTNPFFSIVIPTFNSGLKLKHAIESVLSQTFLDFEILVLDDGSTDGTDRLVGSFPDQRVRYCWNENSGGPARPRNRGIELARADWICFLDADDWWDFNKLEVTRKYIDEGADFLCHGLRVVTDSSPSAWRSVGSWKPTDSALAGLLLNGNPVATSSVVVRKSLLQAVNGFNEAREMVAAEDYNTWLAIATLTDNFICIPEILGSYYFHPGGISRKNMAPSMRAAVGPFIEMCTSEQAGSVDSYISYVGGRFHFSMGQYKSARVELRKALRYGSGIIFLKTIYMLALVEYYLVLSLFSHGEQS